MVPNLAQDLQRGLERYSQGVEAVDVFFPLTYRKNKIKYMSSADSNTTLT